MELSPSRPIDTKYCLWLYLLQKQPLEAVLQKKSSNISGHWLTCSGRKGFSHRRLFFNQVLFPRVGTGLLSQECRCSGARKKVRTAAIPRILNYITEHHDSSGYYCKYMPLSSSWINEYHHFPRKQTNMTKKHLKIKKKGKYSSEYLILQQGFAFFLSVKFKST